MKLWLWHFGKKGNHLYRWVIGIQYGCMGPMDNEISKKYKIGDLWRSIKAGLDRFADYTSFVVGNGRRVFFCMIGDMQKTGSHERHACLKISSRTCASCAQDPRHWWQRSRNKSRD